jgi:hypothetical protein
VEMARLVPFHLEVGQLELVVTILSKVATKSEQRTMDATTAPPLNPKMAPLARTAYNR